VSPRRGLWRALDVHSTSIQCTWLSHETCHLERQLTQGPPAATARVARHRAARRRLSAGNETRGQPASRDRKSRAPVITFLSPDRRPTTALPCWPAKGRPRSSSATRSSTLSRSACWRRPSATSASSVPTSPMARPSAATSMPTSSHGSMASPVGAADRSRTIDKLVWPAISISRRRIATSTTRSPGPARSSVRSPSGQLSRRLLKLGLT
jgi:hypothetical protein